jgi:hypothetical protein
VRCKQRQKRREMGIPDNRPEMRKRISTRSNVPNPDSLIVASRDEMFPIVRPHNAIASSDMRLASLAGSCVLAQSIFTPHTHRVLQVQDAQAAGAAADVPEPDCAVHAAACEDVVVLWAPAYGEYGAFVAGERVGTRARA